MRISRFYCPELNPEQKLMLLPDAVHRHAIQVLRMKVGEHLRLFDGSGLEYEACLIDVQKRQSQVELINQIETINESPLQTTLLQGVSRGERMDYAIQKAVELGVNRIIPVVTERCNMQLGERRGDKKMQHWQGVLVSACEQSGRSVLPILEEAISFEQALNYSDSTCKLLLDPQAEQHLHDLPSATSVALFIGPEGGFSDDEVVQAQQAGFIGVQFGPRILRTETASTAALAVLQSLWGDLG